jgi:diguanylate cyclase (GGDEF)-like protein
MAKPFLVGFIDLDGMKHINDTFGHQEGNRALVDTAQILRASFRQSDVLARFGGDEFAVLVAEADEMSIPRIVNRVHGKLAVCNAQSGRQYQLSLSIGLAGSELHQLPDLDRLLREADRRMYRNKEARRTSREEFQSASAQTPDR